MSPVAIGYWLFAIRYWLLAVDSLVYCRGIQTISDAT
jgi:hypothetical protein